MKHFFLFISLSLFFFSCKKTTEIVINPSPGAITDPVKIDRVINDSSIVIKWDAYRSADFKSYRLVRVATYLKNGVFSMQYETVDSVSDRDHVSFTENNMPLGIDISYQLYIIKNNMPAYAGTFYGGVIYKRPNSILFGLPKDVLIDKTTKKLFVTEQKKISVIDYNGRVKLTKEFPPGIGYCTLGTYAGASELYVPENDGWLLILDAATLEQKDKIYVKGIDIGSVVAVNEKLYVSSSDMTFSSGYQNCVQVFDRTTKSVIGRTGYWPQTRLVLLEGSAVAEMIDLTINLIPVDLCYYRFAADGTPQVKMQDTYHGDYPMNAAIVRSFPDGNRFITSSSGTIFSKSLLFEKYIKQNGSYSDFAFNNDGSVIYCAAGQQKTIDAVNYPSVSTSKTYPTQMFPYKIFRDGDTLICITESIIYAQSDCYVSVEKINI